MRVAFIINDLSGGGAEKVLLLHCSYLLNDGFEVMIIRLQDGASAYPIDSRAETVILKSARVARGINKILALPIQAWEIARVLRRWRADLCVSNMPRSNIAHVLTRWIGNRRKIVLTEHIATRDNYPSRSFGDRAMRFLVRRFYPKAHVVIAVSDGVAQGLEGFGIQRKSLRVLHNPIDVREIKARAMSAEHVPESKDVLTVISVGRLAEQKDQETLLRAFDIVRRQIPARLIIIGQGPLLQSLENLAAALGISAAVEFLGWQSNPFAWMARSHVFVLSSKYEGFGNVIVEAMACDLPIITTDCPSGPREIVCNGEAGMLVAVGDVTSLAAAIVDVLSNDRLRDHFIAKSKQRVPEFDISLIGRRYAELLKSFVDETEMPNA